MKVYVVYILMDHTNAIYMGTNEEECNRISEETEKYTGHYTWVEEYDFSKATIFDLDCD